MSASAVREVVVVGGGGHAKVVVSTLEAMGYRPAAVYDDNRSRWGQTVLGAPIAGGLEALRDAPYGAAVIAIGDNATRKRIAEQFPEMEWVTAVHPAACVHSSVELGPGSVVFAGAVVQPETWIGAHVIVNTGATVDHDCAVGEFAHLAPGVHLAGGVRVKPGAFLGIGSVVIPGLSVGAWSTVGAGGVVVSELPDGVTAVGVPARPRNK